MKEKSESEVAQSCLTLSDPMDYSLLAPLSMGFSRQEYWSGVSSPSPMHESESEVAQSQIFLNIVYTHHFDDFTTIIRPTTGFFYIKL